MQKCLQWFIAHTLVDQPPPPHTHTHTPTASEVTVGFDQSHYIVLENASNVTVCVNLTGEISRNVQVQVSTEDGSAMGNSELHTSTSSYTFIRCFVP